jgi:hypothetical protein
MTNRIEWLAGRRWAKDVCFASASLLKLDHGPAKLLEHLRRGLQQKPASYALGVQSIIETVETAMEEVAA